MAASGNGDLTGTVAQHYNQLQEAGLAARAESRIFYLRNFNNWIKSMAVSDILNRTRANVGKYEPITVLDMGSGKGGDLLKWKKGNIDQIVCADIAATSVEQCESRYKDMVHRSRNNRFKEKLFSAEFIAADCTKVLLKDRYKDPNTKFDIVSCQFAFHYCFESAEQCEMMIRNACESLKPGGYFFGTTPNSYEIVKRLKASGKNSFGNEVYSVTFEDIEKQPFPLFGTKYNFHLEGVVDCPEFLVYFPLLEKIAAKYDMKLVYRKPFAKYFEENYNCGEGRALLGKMQALEPYPADKGVKVMSDDDDAYKDVSDKIEQIILKQEGGYKPVKVGTLSKAEWEATTLYLVFAFQKMSTESSSTTDTRKPETPLLGKRRADDETNEQAELSDNESPVKKRKADDPVESSASVSHHTDSDSDSPSGQNRKPDTPSPGP